MDTLTHVHPTPYYWHRTPHPDVVRSGGPERVLTYADHDSEFVRRPVGFTAGPPEPVEAPEQPAVDPDDDFWRHFEGDQA